jgi:hypothetical protein
LAIAVAGLLSAGAASARTERPYDAPLPAEAGHDGGSAFGRDGGSGLKPPAAPELTPEYASFEERGVKLVFHLLARDRAHVLLARALAARAELSADLGRDVLGNVEIRVAAMPAQMGALAPPELPPAAAAAAFRDLHLVVMSLGSPMPQDAVDLEERLRHALAHLALDEAVEGREVPRWFHEGFAVRVSGEEGAMRAETLCVAALRDRLLGLRDVAARFPEGPAGSGSIAAAEAADFVRFLSEAPQRQRFPVLIERLREGRSFEGALAAAYDGDLDRLDARFRKDLARRYSFVPVLGGATVLWVLVALGVVIRRRRLARLRAEAGGRRWGQRAPFAGASGRAPGERRAPVPRAPRLAVEEEDDIVQAMPPDPEVPKVEHDGRWYTLH